MNTLAGRNVVAVQKRSGGQRYGSTTIRLECDDPVVGMKVSHEEQSETIDIAHIQVMPLPHTTRDLSVVGLTDSTRASPDFWT
jgi:hypothetical protein